MQLSPPPPIPKSNVRQLSFRRCFPVHFFSLLSLCFPRPWPFPLILPLFLLLVSRLPRFRSSWPFPPALPAQASHLLPALSLPRFTSSQLVSSPVYRSFLRFAKNKIKKKKKCLYSPLTLLFPLSCQECSSSKKSVSDASVFVCAATQRGLQYVLNGANSWTRTRR